MIIKELDRAWRQLYLTVDEGIRSLSTLTLLEASFDGDKSFQYLPKPRKLNQQMLGALGVALPKILPKNSACVVTRQPRRKLS